LAAVVPGLARRGTRAPPRAGIQTHQGLPKRRRLGPPGLFAGTIEGRRFQRGSEHLAAGSVTEIIDQAVERREFLHASTGPARHALVRGVLVERTFTCASGPARGCWRRKECAVAPDRSGPSTMQHAHELPRPRDCGRAARGIVARIWSQARRAHTGRAVLLATGGYANVYFLSTNAMGATGPPYGVRNARRRRCEPVLHADPSACIPQTGGIKRSTLMSSRCATTAACGAGARDERAIRGHSEPGALLRLRRCYPAVRQTSCPATSLRAPQARVRRGDGVDPRRGVYMELRRTDRAARRAGDRRLGTANLFEMYEQITAESPWSADDGSTPPLLTRWGGLG